MATLYRDALFMEFQLRGEPITYYRYVGRCVCFSEMTQDWDHAHSLCNGTGVLYELIDVSAFRALITNYSSRQNYDKRLGGLEEGDIVVSAFPDQIPISESDLIIVPTRHSGYKELITRGAAGSDSLRYDHVTDIDVVYGPAGLIDPSHYSVGGDGKSIVWTGGINATDQYAVVYRYNPKFVVVSGAFSERRQDPNGAPFPVRVGFRQRNQSGTDAV